MAGSHRRHLHWVAALACALIQGCVTPPAAPPPREPVVSVVPDGDWELVNSTFIGTGRIPGVPRATLAFRDGRMSAFSGCNRASAAAPSRSARSRPDFSSCWARGRYSWSTAIH